jgi:hypothetical protein
MIRIFGGSSVFLVDDPTGTYQEDIPLRHYEARPTYLEFNDLSESDIETLTRHPTWIWMWRILVTLAAIAIAVFCIYPLHLPQASGASQEGVFRLMRTILLILDLPALILAWLYLKAARFANVFHVRRSGITMRRGVFRPWVPKDLGGEDITGVEYKPYWWAVWLRLNIGKIIIESGRRTEVISFVGNGHDAYRLVDAVNKRGGTGGIIGALTLLVRTAWKDGEPPPDAAINAILGPVTQKWRAEDAQQGWPG